ncbi:hypothetical protein [Silvanigrella aquatica]|uniref:Cytochrome B n=1 Tax=Silvanigrella aquatica TaxID=1915309 RepID=A0A1L4CZ94_9BACT|nr:hypothetical protein [Silvanigrella aquatica]APJ03268.1 hypothetical protein AXG55_04870 [Silvanigrella aquatica]
MYDVILFIHSWLRWIVTFCLIIVLFRSFSGWIKSSAYLKFDKIMGGIFIGFTHLQLLIGLFLYFSLSPITNMAMNNMGVAMKNQSLRFWAVEHIVAMIIFVIFVQLGRTLSKKAQNSITKHKKCAIYNTIALLILIAGMPWPSRKEIGRPLFMEYPTQVSSN